MENISFLNLYLIVKTRKNNSYASLNTQQFFNNALGWNHYSQSTSTSVQQQKPYSTSRDRYHKLQQTNLKPSETEFIPHETSLNMLARY